MLSNLRHKNKSVLARTIFKWAFLVMTIVYLLVVIIGHSTAEYTEIKTMMLDEDRERLRRNELNFERTLEKIIPDFLSYWHFALGIIMLGAAILLFKIMTEEAAEAKKVDESCVEVYRDIHYSNNNPLGSIGQANILNFKPFQV